MFQCRMCAENPFLGMFGDDPPPKEKKSKKQKDDQWSRDKKSNSGKSRGAEVHKARTEEEASALVTKWLQYAHPRAYEIFAADSLENVLKEMALAIDREDDPVLGDGSKCVFWYGEVTAKDNQAALRIMKPGESEESVTFVNRLLAYIFATDESFEHLMQLPKEAFRMRCGDQLCICLGHISLTG
mmetsp:Transcript_3742/g.9547  ORF Transcript_3742/g.9547 Transcript_3742/m.9547 type:complete len:185 (-) Transcript_3742:123-677(-)